MKSKKNHIYLRIQDKDTVVIDIHCQLQLIMLPHANSHSQLHPVVLPSLCIWEARVSACSSPYYAVKRDKTVIARVGSRFQEGSRRCEVNVNGTLEPVVKSLAAVAMAALIWAGSSDAQALTALQQSIRSDVPVVGALLAVVPSELESILRRSCRLEISCHRLKHIV